jgi:hypothetical protein
MTTVWSLSGRLRTSTDKLPRQQLSDTRRLPKGSRLEAEGQGLPAQRLAANAVLTTVVDTSGPILDAETPEQVIRSAQADCGGLVWTQAFS